MSTEMAIYVCQQNSITKLYLKNYINKSQAHYLTFFQLQHLQLCRTKQHVTISTDPISIKYADCSLKKGWKLKQLWLAEDLHSPLLRSVPLSSYIYNSVESFFKINNIYTCICIAASKQIYCSLYS